MLWEINCKVVFLIVFPSFILKKAAFLIGFNSFFLLFSYSFYLFCLFLMHDGCSFSRTLAGLTIIPFLMLFINQLPIVYCFPVYHSPYILLFSLTHCHFFLLQGRRIKNYCPAKVVTNSFHPIPLLVFSDSCFLLLFFHSLVW